MSGDDDDPFKGEFQDVVATNPADEVSRKDAVAAYEKMASAGIKKLMGDVECRAWVWTILRFCHISQTSWRSDPMLMARLEGERNVGNKIFADILSVAEDEYLRMANEGKILG